MRSISTIALLLCSSAALAAPPDHAQANGHDKICDTDTVSADDAVDALLDDARAEVEAAAALTGLTLEDSPPRVALSGQGQSRLYVGECTNGKIDAWCGASVGAYKLAFGGETVELDATAYLTIDFSEQDDGTRTGEVALYDADGQETATLTFEGESSDPLNPDGVAHFVGPDGLGVGVVHMYGDIILGDASLDWDFND